MGRATVVCGLGACVPSRVVTNDELAAYLDTDDEWIRTRTGIRQRHWIGAGEATGDLAVEAGQAALKSAGEATADMLIVATSTPDRPLPSTAPDVAARLGLGFIPAFDVAAACTGFVYSLAIAAGVIATGAAGTVLVIGADTYSTILAPNDRTTRAIFGDGAGAMLVRAGDAEEPGALLGLCLGSDGAKGGLAEIPAGGSRQRSTGLPARSEDSYLVLQGPPVFAEAVIRMSAAVKEAAARTGWELADVDRFVLHQANARILSAVARKLGLAPELFVSNVDRVGNTVAASIPLALADGVAAGEVRGGHRLILAAFGGGLTWGAVALVWPSLGP